MNTLPRECGKQDVEVLDREGNVLGRVDEHGKFQPGVPIVASMTFVDAFGNIVTVEVGLQWVSNK